MMERSETIVQKSVKTSVSDLNVEVRVHEETTSDPRPVFRGYSQIDEPRLRVVVLAVLMVIAGVYTALHIGKGWVPADDGTLSQSALRVMHGQLPHRDFVEIYSGGLSFIHALAFRIFGVNLMSLRYCVFLFFLAWLPAVYYIALRFVSPVSAGFITLLAVSWSYPNYPAAMPSWYNLFFATFGAAALLRYLDVRTRRWLFVAGVCGGASVLIKIIGAYYIAGAFLFLAFLEQSESADTDSTGNGWPYRAFSVGSLLLFLGVLLQLIRTKLAPAELFDFFLPSASIVMLLIFGERDVNAGAVSRFKTMFRLVTPFLCGLASVMTLFLIPYALAGGVSQWFAGVFSSATSRIVGLGVARPVAVSEVIWLLPVVAIAAAAMFWDKFQSKLIGGTLLLSAAVIVFRGTQTFPIALGIWHSVALITPVAVVLGAWLVGTRRKVGGQTKRQRQQVVLLISLAATCSLVQFPFSVAIYLSYCIPLTLLAIVAIVSTGKTQPGTFALASLAAFYLTFAVVILVPLYIYEVTWMIGPMHTMHAPRAGGLKIEEAAFFDDLARFLQEHSPNGLMFAGNDCPELYFLPGLTNVGENDGGEASDAMLKVIDRDDLNLVVINDAPFFPGASFTPEAKAEVQKRFPHTTRFGIFQIFWKK
jgi:hypothetical protein